MLDMFTLLSTNVLHLNIWSDTEGKLLCKGGKSEQAWCDLMLLLFVPYKLNNVW
jgi:hypothetical protein